MHSPQAFNLTEALSVPQVKAKLGKGIRSFQDLGQLLEFHRQYSQSLELQKELRRDYGKMFDDLGFLEQSGATKVPYPSPGSHISSRMHWVAIEGVFAVDYTSLLNEGMDFRFFVNTPSLLAPVLILSPDSWRIFRTIFSSASRTTRMSEAMIVLLYSLEVLRMSGCNYGEYVDDSFVRWCFLTKTPEEMLNFVAPEWENLLQDDQANVISRVMHGEYCFPLRQWINQDSLYYQMALPSWSFSSNHLVDYTGNCLTNWDFFTLH